VANNHITGGYDKLIKASFVHPAAVNPGTQKGCGRNAGFVNRTMRLLGKLIALAEMGDAVSGVRHKGELGWFRRCVLVIRSQSSKEISGGFGAWVDLGAS